MSVAKNGDTVRVHYTGKLDDGTVFDTSVERDPMEFTIGEGRLIPDFEYAVVGMNPSETKTIRVLAENAYGPYDEQMLMVVERTEFQEDLKPEVGQQLKVSEASGESFIVQVTEVSETNVTLDGNHPLAGQDLTFDIQLTEIV